MDLSSTIPPIRTTFNKSSVFPDALAVELPVHR